MLAWLKWWKNDVTEVLPSLRKLTDLHGKRVLVRAAFDVPIKDGAIMETFRIEQVLPTLHFLAQAGAKTIIVSHIGRKPEETLKPVFDYLKEQLPIEWGGSLAGDTKERVSALPDGGFLLLENLRQDPRESENDDSLAEGLASLADIYVNDAFSASHRAHASIVGVPKYLPSYFGFNFIEEYQALSKALKPQHPALFIIGGAKFETKMPLVLKFADSYDQVFVGGALTNDVFKAKGMEIGHSLISSIDLKNHAILTEPNIFFPEDVVVEGPNGRRTAAAHEVQADETIYDVGPVTLQKLQPLIESAATILWNGPLGNYEKGYAAGTEELARAIAASRARSIVGGGDTIASIRSLGLGDQFSFLSTSGGAMLVFLETGTLPGIEAILNTDRN